ncbi:multidrug transporter [Caulobacter sp. Root1455]|uniref:SapC family protein n=1 Tax=unclassified Caulobacter TaxID=2648921 RepID=UPI0006FAA76C|nr:MULTISPECIES: SapC family protein [unclassified Caulobacter]KQY28063.1 multidrug transporter [Caulobacter sp. Root487D2Y]KQZ04774.1 multidrug transporter [Caulobacter sp. Root1455]
MDLELLNAERHLGLHQAEVPVDGAHFVQIVASEFATAAATCPIFLTKSPETGQFYAGAMFGFEPGENLLRRGASGRGAFLPLDLERQGYFLAPGGVAIDPGHPRFSTGRGAALFEKDGLPSQALRRIQHVLGQLNVGVPATDAFIQSLVALGLVEPIDIDLSFDDGRSLSLAGLYTVSLDALGELNDAAVVDLFRRGHLQLAYAMAGSLKQVSVLANLRNERLAA